jgi:hypothetical protein
MFSRSMRRAVASVLALAALAATTAPAAGAAPAGAARLPASVALVDCSPAKHRAVFRGRMTRVSGSERMGMRFVLLERTGSAGFEPVTAPGLGRWRRSRPGVRAFGYRQGVRGLAENAVYRMRVDFRWWSSTSEVVGGVRRRSRACRQFQALPNLRARVLDAGATSVAGVVRYWVRVANRGTAAVSETKVRLTVDGDVVDTRAVPSLAPGAQRRIGFRGPACRSTVEVRADPDAEIVELSEADNAQQIACADLTRR